MTSSRSVKGVKPLETTANQEYQVDPNYYNVEQQAYSDRHEEYDQSYTPDNQQPYADRAYVTADIHFPPPPLTQQNSMQTKDNVKETKVYLEGYSGASNWGAYLTERIAFLPTILVSVGYMLSAFYYFENDSSLLGFKVGEFIWGICSLILFMVQLRLMDDHKDWKTDITAHADRALPRGIINPRELQNVIFGFSGILAINAILLGILVDMSCGILAIAILLFQNLMWKEFGLGKFLSKSPFIYAFLHQPVVVLYVIFAICMFNDMDGLKAFESWLLGFHFLGVSFTYEICRKLDPYAHPLLGYYRQATGRFATFVAITIAIGITSATAFLISLNIYSWIPDIVVFLVCAVYLFGLSKDVSLEEWKSDKELPSSDPKAKAVELLVTLVTVWHVFVIPLTTLANIYPALFNFKNYDYQGYNNQNTNMYY